MATAIVGVDASLNPGHASPLAGIAQDVARAMSALAAVLAIVLGVPSVVHGSAIPPTPLSTCTTRC